MPRTRVRVRPATVEDLPALLELSDELRDQVLPIEPGSRGRGSTMAGRSQLVARYTEALEDPERHLVLAFDGTPELAGQALGMAMFTVTGAGLLLDIPAVHINHAVVADRHRRRGAGKALVAAAAAFAEDRGIDQLVVSVHPTSRDAARFFARLGFTPLAVRRSAPVSVVRRRLQLGDPLTDRLVRRRASRSVRRTAPVVTEEPS